MNTLGKVSVLAFSVVLNSGAQAGPGPAPLAVAGAVRLVHEGHAGATRATGVVDAVEPAKHKITVSHGAIKSLGWPAMTMDFAVNQAIDLTTVRAGTRVNFTLVRGANGSWVVDSLKPQ